MRPDVWQLVTRTMANGLKPRQRLSLSAWADLHRVLSAKGSSEPGRWKTSRTPYLRTIMDDLSDSSPVQRVVVKKSTQVGMTEVGLNWIGYHIERELGPMLVVVPTLEVRKRWVLQRLQPMLNDTDCLRKLSSVRKRDSANSEDIKDYPNAMVVLSGANSPSSLRSMPIKHVLNDEVDAFPWDVGDEGDPLGLIRRRQANFPQRKELDISTPTVKDASRIDDEYTASDQRSYHVPCPECGHYQPLVWRNLIYSADLSSVAYACRECGSLIEEHHKTRMLTAGRWVAKYPERRVHGYHINGLYAPIGLGLSWRELVLDWKESQDDIAKLKRFVNTVLGEVWEDRRMKDLTPAVLADRAEDYPLRAVPPGCLVITAGVDTQDDRLAVILLGHGEGGIEWVLDWVELPGSPGRAAVWDALTEYLNTPLMNAFGVELSVQATAIDSGGHHTHDVYNYVRNRRIRRPMAIKGATRPGQAILGRAKHVDVNVGGRVIKNGVKLWPVGTDTTKHTLYNALVDDAEVEPEARKVRFSGGLDPEFYNQLIAETFDPEKNRWLLRKGRRNEALDDYVYAKAASQHPEIRVHAKRPRDWERLALMLEPEKGRQAEPATPQKTPPAPRSAPPRRRRGPLVR